MKKLLFLYAFFIFFTQESFSQTQSTLSPVEIKLADSLCDCVTKLDLSKIKGKKEAIAAYTNCLAQHINIFYALAAERKLDITNTDEGRKLGLDIAKDLMAGNCTAFAKLSLLTVENQDAANDNTGTTTGIIIRMDNKGFNYLVVNENNSDKSFLWLRQFPGSERFMNDATSYIGKKVKISWQEMDVYLPSTKGYHNVKEITGIDLL